jgi:hypothetical protein
MSAWWRTLLGFGSVPGDAEEVRGFLQARVRRFIGLLAAFHLVLYAIEIGLRAWLGSAPDREPAGMPPILGGIALTVGLSATWLVLRRARLSVGTLAVTDAAVVVLVGALNGWLLSLSDSRPRPEYGFVVSMVLLLVVRAALVPSPALRTGILTLVAFVPLVAGTWLTHDRGIDPPFVPSPLGCAVIVSLWGVYTSAVTAFVARALHGLERRVRETMRLGQYTLDGQIGAGGMGVVYRAHHALLRRPTAVKLLPVDKAGAAAIERFEREVQHTAALTHPNTIAIFDFGRTPDGVFYYAMEYVDGFDLEHLVTCSGPLPPARVVHLLDQVAGALAEAHAAGIVHRDVKPANLMLCQRSFEPDFVKVLDFGLAHEIQRATEESRGVTGTPLFLAPETAARGVADARSDIYALGAVAWFLLYGRPVFTGTTIVQVCAQHLHAQPVAPPGAPAIPAALERLVLECLAKRPDDRPADAETLRARLRSLDDVSAWTPAEARAWWEQWSARLRGPAPHAARGPGASIVVDLVGRAA